MDEVIETVPYEHTINLVESDEVIEICPKRTMIILTVDIEAGGVIEIPAGAQLAMLGGRS